MMEYQLVFNGSREDAKKRLDETPEPLRSFAIHFAWLIRDDGTLCHCADCNPVLVDPLRS